MKLLKCLIHAFGKDELAAKRWLKGILLAILPIFIQVMVADSWMAWSLKEWGYHLLPSVIGFIYGSIQGKPATPSPPSA